jgi:hypothetical protein
MKIRNLSVLLTASALLAACDHQDAPAKESQPTVAPSTGETTDSAGGTTGDTSTTPGGMAGDAGTTAGGSTTPDTAPPPVKEEPR